jgi:hypothetical protein
MAANVITTYDGTTTTQQYFENIYTTTASISDDVYTAVYGYFESITQGAGAAASLTGAFLDACNFEGRNPMVELEAFRQYPDTAQRELILVLMNSVRVGTSLLGRTVVNPPDKYALRQVLF